MDLAKSIKPTVRALMPEGLWFAAGRVKATLVAARKERRQTYQGVCTLHSTQALHRGAYAQAFDRHWRRDPSLDAMKTRMRHYYVTQFARLALKQASGDLAFVGVSYGVSPRIIYDVCDVGSRLLHFIDPFIAVDGAQRNVVSKYNSNPDTAMNGYPPGVKIMLHLILVPDALPVKGIGPLSFVHMDTSHAEAEAKSLPYFFGLLSPGGAIVIDKYANDGGEGGSEAIYDPVLAKLGIEPLWLPTGQAVLCKC